MKKYTFNKAAHMGSLSYRVSDKILHMPMWLLFGMSVILSIILGMVGNYCAEITSDVVDGVKAIRDIFIAYLVINIMYVIIQFSLEAFMRAFRLNTINNSFLKEYDRVFKSRTFAISQIGPAKIESTVNARACIIGDMACCSVSILRVAIPFIVIIYKIAVINWIAAIIMLTLMVIAALMMLFGDKFLHFNTSRAEMKGDMQTISVNNFMVVRMLKYMGAFSYAHDRLKVAQDEANPSIHCVTRIVYNGFVGLLYNTPTIIAMAIAMLSDNLGLAVFVAINEWSISALVDRVVSITESFSEKFGYDHVLESLKADDVPVESKPVMPEHMILKGVEFYYPTDHNKVNSFTIDNLMIEKGKRYRVSGPSGSGKSSYFKYLAGEMEANKPFEVRTFYIHQRSELVAGTVRENLTLGNSYVPDRVLEELIREVKLGEWFDRLPDGLDTKLGDCGLEPSGGEASRISLLRLFVHLRNYTETGSHPITDEVIILDEVTSALDKRDVFIKDDELSTEETVIKVIDRETRGSTMFVISHEDVSSNAFGFKDIVNEQLIIDILPDGRRVLKSM